MAADLPGEAVGAFVSAHAHGPVGAHGHHGAVEGVAYRPVWRVQVDALPACTRRDRGHCGWGLRLCSTRDR